MKIKFRYVVIFVMMFAMVCTIFLINRKKDYVKCSAELKEDVTLMAEFGMIVDNKSHYYGAGVLSFKTDDIIYGLGHNMEGDVLDNRVYKITPEFNSRTPEEMGGVSRNPYKSDFSLLGEISSNNDDGIILRTTDVNEEDYQTIKIANEITSGDAELWMRDENGVLQKYTISVQIVVEKGKERLDFTITDERLIEKTNGVISGMSGSPIIQNDKLIGILSHAYINEPYTGKANIIWNIACIEENIKK